MPHDGASHRNDGRVDEDADTGDEEIDVKASVVEAYRNDSDQECKDHDNHLRDDK